MLRRVGRLTPVPFFARVATPNKEGKMGVKLTDPKELVDSIADGAVELAGGPVRVASNIADVASSFSKEVKSNMDDFKGRMPEDPAAIIDCAVKGAAETVKAGLGMAEGIGKGIMDTFEAVKSQIKRVTG